MEKKICLFLCLFFLGFNLYAQKFAKSFKTTYLAKLYANCPDSLKKDLFAVEPPMLQHKFAAIKSLETMENLVEEAHDVSTVVLRYRAKDFWAQICCDKDNFSFDFFYVDKTGSACCLCLLKNVGTYSKTITTQSGAQYDLNFSLGFLELKENNLPLLNCYCSIQKNADNEPVMVLIPFEGTNPLVWQRQTKGVFVSAF